MTKTLGIDWFALPAAREAKTVDNATQILADRQSEMGTSRLGNSDTLNDTRQNPNLPGAAESNGIARNNAGGSGSAAATLRACRYSAEGRHGRAEHRVSELW